MKTSKGSSESIKTGNRGHQTFSNIFFIVICFLLVLSAYWKIVNHSQIHSFLNPVQYG